MHIDFWDQKYSSLLCYLTKNFSLKEQKNELAPLEK